MSSVMKLQRQQVQPQQMNVGYGGGRGRGYSQMDHYGMGHMGMGAPYDGMGYGGGRGGGRMGNVGRGKIKSSSDLTENICACSVNLYSVSFTRFYVSLCGRNKAVELFGSTERLSVIFSDCQFPQSKKRMITIHIYGRDCSHEVGH